MPEARIVNKEPHIESVEEKKVVNSGSGEAISSDGVNVKQEIEIDEHQSRQKAI